MSSTTPVGLPELKDAHESAKVLPYLREVWSRRDFISYVAMNELKSRQITNVLGNFWHLLNPLLSIGIYYIIFGLLLGIRGDGNFLLFLTVGLFIFQFTQKSTTDGARSIISNPGLLKAVRFPRVILPVTSTFTELLASISTFAMMFVILLTGGEAPRLTWLLLPVIVSVQFVFNLGTAMVAARLTTQFRDMTQILPFVFRLLLYASGVIYNVDIYAEGNRTIEVLFILNPVYCFISAARWAMLGTSVDGAVFVSALAWAIVFVTVGFWFFRAAEDRYARD